MAIALSKAKVQAMHSLNIIYSFVVLVVVNVAVLILANSLFPTHVVLGSAAVPYAWAIYHSMFKLTVISIIVMLLVTYWEWKHKMVFSPKQWMMTYFVVNAAILWEITRFADNLGVGVSSWVVLLILAFVFNFVQGMAMLKLGKYLKDHGQV